METQTTDGITVTVFADYQPDMSNEMNHMYLFSYRIRIANLSGYTMQLTARHWHIWDSDGEVRTVDGPGVIGQQPVIGMGECFEYTSACNLKTGFGTMEGFYLMASADGSAPMRAAIPRFVLEAPSIKN